MSWEVNKSTTRNQEIVQRKEKSGKMDSKRMKTGQKLSKMEPWQRELANLFFQ